MVIASFLIDDKNKKFRFFEEIFLLADISIDVSYLNNVKINFNDKILRKGLYITTNTLSTTK